MLEEKEARNEKQRLESFQLTSRRPTMPIRLEAQIQRIVKKPQSPIQIL
jgi:hypothetical protein